MHTSGRIRQLAVFITGRGFRDALLTVDLLADKARAPLGRHHPGPIYSGWLMAHMLRVSTVQLGNPLLPLVPMEAYNPSQHGLKFANEVSRDRGTTRRFSPRRTYAALCNLTSAVRGSTSIRVIGTDSHFYRMA